MLSIRSFGRHDVARLLELYCELDMLKGHEICFTNTFLSEDFFFIGQSIKGATINFSPLCSCILIQ